MKLAEKRDKDRGKLRTVIEWVLAGEPLPRELGDHPLKGEWQPSRDLHIEPDWVLIYRVDGDAVRFERTGTLTCSDNDSAYSEQIDFPGF